MRYNFIMEEHKKILKLLDIWENDISIKSIDGGLTNNNYFVIDGNKKYIARFAPHNTKILGLNRQKEIQNTKIASENNIGPDVKKYYKNYDLLILEFIEGNILSVGVAQQIDTIKKIAELFLKLHSLAGFSGNRLPLQRAESYFNEVKSRNGWIPDNLEESFIKTKEIISQLKPCVSCSCHLDVMLENVIVCSDGNLKLIDWEYSENADPRYDLAMYIIKAKLNREQEEHLFLCYGINKEEDKQDIRKMKTLVALAEATYGVLQNVISDRISVGYR